MLSVRETCQRAAAAKHEIGALGTHEKNRVLLAIADALQARRADIKAANALDIEAGRKNGLNEGLIDRLTLGDDRIDGVAEGCRQVAALPDPVGEVTEMKVTPDIAAPTMAKAARYHGVRRFAVKNPALSVRRPEIQATTNSRAMYPVRVAITAAGVMRANSTNRRQRYKKRRQGVGPSRFSSPSAIRAQSPPERPPQDANPGKTVIFVEIKPSN